MTDQPYQYFMDRVFPYVPDDIRSRTLGRYPNVTLRRGGDALPLAERRIVMFVGLTGTGKSTTLVALGKRASLTFTTSIPSRRELTDLVIIPCAQVATGKPITHLSDREARFAHTRIFREQLAPGGAAEAFTWVNTLGDADTLIISEGVRGPNEIAYALEHTRWSVIELWVDPLTRLRRLSTRAGSFDRVANADTADLSFLPEACREEARALIAAGEISPQAVATARAEALNYGGVPYDPDNNTSRYRCLHIDNLTPDEVADAAEDAIRDFA